MAARLVIVGALLALLAGVAVAGTASAHRQLGSNYVSGDAFTVVLPGGEELCQDAERAPAGTTAVRLTLGTYGRPGPPLEVRFSGDGVTAAGALGGGWSEGPVVIPIEEIATQRGGELCLRNVGDHRIAVAGARTSPGAGAVIEDVPGDARVRIEYTSRDERSWWALLGEFPDRIAAVRVGFPGSATGWLWLGLLVAVVGGAAAVLLRGREHAGVAVTAIALGSALAWGLLIPPFHVPDETSHVFYATYLAETGELPRASPENVWYSAELNQILTVSHFPQVAGRPYNRPPWSEADRRALEAVDREGLDELGFGDASTASSNSPVYYALQAPVVEAGPAGVFDRLALMRIVAALLSALTVACIYAFLRELLPGSPWAATVGALAAALQPLFGFVSSGVNNDGLLYLCSAFVMWALARAFRRGLTPGRAALVMGPLAFGVLVKQQMLAFVPAALLALGLLALRGRGGIRRLAWRPLAVGAAAALAPLVVYYVLGQTIWQRPVVDRVGPVASAAVANPDVAGILSYVWQAYLPRLPFMTDWFGGFALKTVWVDGLVGRFGWLDYTFPGWVRVLGAAALALIAVGAVATLVRRRHALRARLGEAAVYVLALVAFLVMVAVAGYVGQLSGERFEQARYLLPLLPFYAAAVGLAAHALGRRRAYVLGSLIVVATLGHAVFSHLLTLTRYYG